MGMIGSVKGTFSNPFSNIDWPRSIIATLAVNLGTRGIPWVYNKFFKKPLKHIDDDVKKIQIALWDLHNRLNSIVIKNESPSTWKSHKLESKRIELIKAWIQEIEKDNYGSKLAEGNNLIQK